jgi:hypothetical protein
MSNAKIQMSNECQSSNEKQRKDRGQEQDTSKNIVTVDMGRKAKS